MTAKKRKKKMTQKEQLWALRGRKERRAWLNKRSRDFLNKTTLEQRKTFIEALWAGKAMGEAALLAGFTNEKGHPCIETAMWVWKRNTKRVSHIVMMTVDQVR